MSQANSERLRTVLVSLVLGCNGTYSDGYHACYEDAFARACMDACDIGYASGYQEGIGYRVAARTSATWSSDSYDDSYDEGCQDGTSDGRDDGYRFGTDYCPTVGYRDAIEGWDFDFGVSGRICTDPGAAR